MTSLNTLLIANRGEIALRVVRTARELGIRTVALFTHLDASAPHVRAADAAVEVDSYLDVDAVVAAAVAVGADAVHPGYGFLSERASFAQALEDAGITLVGPSAAVMEQMGRKDAARHVAEAAGVPVVPAYGIDSDPATFAYPVLVKAAAGGGGKGMRVVRSAPEFAEAVAAARRESASAFGDDTLLVEKYVERGRHIEVQVVGDTHGTVLHFGERDCSTQRRHQKVLEEAPAPNLSEATRTAIRQAGVDLASQVGYTGAGTVEFLLDEATGEFYFLEMNTRLQVEHPVTEAVTGVDLVALQLQVAAGAPLGLTQDDVVIAGHAIEARVYAEDAFGGFLPQAGRATYVRWPAEVRVDHALESGQVVSTAYDPMLGKVIAGGADREEARQALLHALDDTVILGLTTNTGFLRALAATDAFRDAAIDTAWLDRAPVADLVPAPSRDLSRTIGAWVDARAGVAATSGAFRADGWRIGGERAAYRTVLDGVEFLVSGAADPAASVESVAGQVARGTSGADDGPEVPQRVRELATEADGPVRRSLLLVDGERIDATVLVGTHAVEVVVQGQRFGFDRPAPAGDRGAVVGDGALIAPMPGTVLDVRCAVGDEVAEGEVLAVLEAMKMEIALKAPFAGTVAQVPVAPSDQVALGALLVEVVDADQ